MTIEQDHEKGLGQSSEGARRSTIDRKSQDTRNVFSRDRENFKSNEEREWPLATDEGLAAPQSTGEHDTLH